MPISTSIQSLEFTHEKTGAMQVDLVTPSGFKTYANDPARGVGQAGFLNENDGAMPGDVFFVPNMDHNSPRLGQSEYAVAVLPEDQTLWSLANLAGALAEGDYSLSGKINGQDIPTKDLQSMLVGLGLGLYDYNLKTDQEEPPLLKIAVPKRVHIAVVNAAIHQTAFARDLVNMPANILTPNVFAQHVESLANEFNAAAHIHRGPNFEKDFPLIHAVGRASIHPPCVAELLWGEESDPLITLIGKGVTFDSGGMNIKSNAGMLTMKRDMGGAAAAFATASMIMSQKLPVRVRLILALAENSVDHNAFRPGDVLESRSGKTVEITNTDAEGRLVLADGLALAIDTPNLNPLFTMTFATLTGAQRLAHGFSYGGVMGPKEILRKLEDIGEQPMIRDRVASIPDSPEDRAAIESAIADIKHYTAGPISGPGHAYQFLKYMYEAAATRANVESHAPLVHADFGAWNPKSWGYGRPMGGELQLARTVVEHLQNEF